ncbi:MAG: phosphatase PAP2 family protein [Flammeovirgaceae bacterium]|nr:phosphatase PAP2 family protein [Flammeovirgaceae bacterium]MBR07836.1 phosphatase PAP2 family protein [Rickettsiales bacterium]HCX24274.1 phosphatase PAP2 family protein [Cytophagales bacterium]|tara:strand:+ start:1366 stop:1935 length:570 start_codon:yes stop_codon:yes gene_type:complete
MLDWLKEIDLNLFLEVNGLGSPYLDGFMIFMSKKLVWIPLYLLLTFRLYQKYDIKVYQPLIAMGLIILCSDQTTSHFMKPFFERYRPCKDPELEGMVMIIDKCRGLYGFASGHSANAFAVAGFFFYQDKKWIGIPLLFWAATIAYSRVYLGVHYPGDVLVGSLIGLSYSFFAIKGHQYLATKSKHIDFL